MVKERWRIRRADVTDAPAIAAAHVQSWRDAYSDILAPEEFDSRPAEVRTAQWSERLADDKLVVSVAEGSQGVVGFVSIGPSSDDDTADAVGELTGLYLVKDAWGEGLGRKMLAVGVDCLARRGFSIGVLWVLRDNARARRFYEASGWSPDGAMKDCFGGANAPAVRLSRSLATSQDG